MYPKGKYCTTAMPIVHTDMQKIQILHASEAKFLVVLQLKLRTMIVAGQKRAQSKTFRRQLLLWRRQPPLH